MQYYIDGYNLIFRILKDEFILWLNKRYKKRLVRQEHEKKKVEKKEKPIKKTSHPPKNATLNECFDYYLYTFEKEDERG